MKTINNGELRKNNINEKVTLYGFVANKRKMGELTFVDLRDRWGITQIVIKNIEVSFSKESVLEVIGTVKERQDKNEDLPTGNIEIIAEKINVLSKAEQLPFIIHDDLEAKEETKLKHRYLDLRRPKMQKNLILRHKFLKAIRDFFDSEDFLEIETPYLSKSTPEGARDFLVPTRKAGKFFALPQSPQLYKQLLMAAGMEKYFQITKAFRDEDSRKDRQPEFTQLDIEMSFVSPEDIKNLIEKMIPFVLNKLGHDIKTPFQRMDYTFAINNYGTDKPDIRYGLELQNVTNLFENTEFNSFKAASTIKMIYLDKDLSKKEIKKLEEIAKKNKAKGLAWAVFNEKQGPGFKFFEQEIQKIVQEYNLPERGTLLFVADELSNANQSLGAVRVELNNMFKFADENEFNFVWIENWPLFEQDKETGRMIAAHHPFTAPLDKDIDTFDKTPLKASAQAYDLVLNGYEIGGGSKRIFDSEVQKRMFKTIGMSEEKYTQQFGFFLEAFKYGLPPHAGIAFGIDRMMMILAKENSIRDVIAFPKNAKSISVMEEAPSEPSSDQLNEYSIKITQDN